MNHVDQVLLRWDRTTEGEPAALNPPRVWCSGWSTSLDGMYEVRASVAQSVEGFMPGLEVSRLGGDCLPGYGDPVATLEEAIQLAKAQRSQWHELDGGDE